MKALLCLCALFLVAASFPSRHPWNVTGDIDAPLMTTVMRLKLEEHRECVEEHLCPTVVPAVSNMPCEGGKSGEYDCRNVDLLSFVPLKDLGGQGSGGNDIWGWTDPDTGKEYAIVGLHDGTSFVDVSDPVNPIVLAFLPTHTASSLWRDIKVFKNHAFIVSEASNHGMQVFDLTNLRSMSGSEGLVIVAADAHYNLVSNTHNIVGNEETGFMYAVGSTRTSNSNQIICRGGLHMIDVKDPLNPEFAGCFGDDGYVHDAQCVVYNGPDTRFKEKEICFCYNEDTLTIVDVENKEGPEILSRVPYNNAYYTHQGWLNEDQSYLMLNDELDEIRRTDNKHTRSMIWNVRDLKDPKLEYSFYSEKEAVDHNLYIRDNLVYESNYCAGLRILDVSKIEDFEGVTEVGYFDVDPDCDSPSFNGAWSSYVYFESETIILSSIERGLFVLKFTGVPQGN